MEFACNYLLIFAEPIPVTFAAIYTNNKSLSFYLLNAYRLY